MSHKLDSIEDDLSSIKTLLNQENSSLIQLKQNLIPVLEHFSFNSNAVNSNAVNPKSTSSKSTNPKNANPKNTVNVNPKKTVNFSVPPQNQSQNQKDSFPLISQLFESELLALPSYLKGRLTCTKINSFIDDLNRILKEKYTVLLKSNPSKLAGDLRQRFFEWRGDENEETRGRFFVTEADLKAKNGLDGFKFDQVGRNILKILRQVGKIKEVRSVGIVRYVLN